MMRRILFSGSHTQQRTQGGKPNARICGERLRTWRAGGRAARLATRPPHDRSLGRHGGKETRRNLGPHMGSHDRGESPQTSVCRSVPRSGIGCEMAELTAIEWADHTFAPWFGCDRVSPGCDLCYAEDWTVRRFHKAEWGNSPRNPLSEEHVGEAARLEPEGRQGWRPAPRLLLATF